MLLRKTNTSGGYILSCRTVVTNEQVMYIKTNSKGIIQWRKVYQFSLDMSPGEIITVSNGYVTTGEISNVNSNDAYILRLNSVGDTLWLKRYGGNNSEFVYSIDRIGNEGYIIGGSSKSFSTNEVKEVPFLQKLIHQVNIHWFYKYINSLTSSCNGVTSTYDRGYAFTGCSDTAGTGQEDFAYLIKTDSNGKEQFKRIYLYSPLDGIMESDIKQTSDTGYVISGTRYHNDMYDILVIKTDKNGLTQIIGIAPIGSTIPLSFKLYQNYPNPFNPVTNIKFNIPLIKGVSEGRGVLTQLIIYDVTGREVSVLVNDLLKPGEYSSDWNASNFASGVYFYKITAGDFSDVKKMILLK